MRVVRWTIATLFVLVIAGCGSGKDTAMPDVTGKKLDDAKSDIERAGIDDKVEIVGGGTFGVVVESNWQVCDQVPSAGQPVKNSPRLTVDRSCENSSSSEAASTPTTPPGPGVTTPPAPEVTSTTISAYSYAGPKYEVVIVDKRTGMGELDQYWVYTDKLDYSTDAYKDQIRALITDVAHSAGTNRIILEVVTDKEIAQAEAVSTSEAFVAEHGPNYAIKVIPKKETTGWVASYTGGIDPDAGKLSDSDAAFEVIWFGYSDNPTIEKWKPAA